MQNKQKERVRILIGAMGDDEFERFMAELLPRIFPGFDHLEPSFNFIGKTTKGKCDAHVYHSSDDTYTSIICTTKQTDLRTKILTDINKLSSTKFAAKIRRILLCVNTPLKDEVEDYRTACAGHGWGLDLLSLERITLHTLSQSDLLSYYFDENPSAKTNHSYSLRRFDCGTRLKISREDISIPISRLIEEINFPSEREWRNIEAGELEVNESYLTTMSNLTGISSEWLKHGTSPKYPSETIYDDDAEPIYTALSEEPLLSCMAIAPEGMDIALIVQISKLRWRIFFFGFSLDFWNWTGDENHIPIIFQLLRTIDKKARHPHGRIITQELMNELRTGATHPSVLFKRFGHNSYWFSDLFDLYYHFPIANDQYKHYGKWFVNLQKEFRKHVKETTANSEPHPQVPTTPS